MTVKKSKIVIIGGGASGAISLLRISDKLRVLQLTDEEVIITVIEPKEVIGLGRAYSTQQLEHLLNVPVEKMSVNPADSEDFASWLTVNHPHAATADEWPFVSRKWFGEYLREKISHLDAKSFSHLKSAATNVSYEGNSWKITLRDGQKIEADFLIVATGYETQVNRDILKLDLESTQSISHLIINADESAKVENIEVNAKVLILGTGLTAVDIVRQIERKRGKNSAVKIRMLSRHGFIPLSHLAPGTPSKSFKIPNWVQKSPREIFRSARDFQRREDVSWQSLADQIRLQVTEIWKSWSLAEKTVFFTHVKTYWEIIRHRVPSTVWNQIQSARDSGRLEVLAGRIMATRSVDSEIEIEYQPRGTGHREKLICDYLIIATDVKINQSILDPLTGKNASLGLEESPFQLGYTKTTAENIWFVGPPAKGQFWEITAVPEIVKQADKVADEIFQQIMN